MDRQAFVYIDYPAGPVLVGRLLSRFRKGREGATFEYDPSWLARPDRFALEPALALAPGPFHAGAEKVLFGSIGDSAPDRWGRALMRRRMLEVEVFPGVEDVLRQLQAANVPMYIMSTSSPGNIRKLLKARGLEGYFKRIYGNVGVFGKAKMLRRVIEQNRLDPAGVFYIGDEARDVEATKRVGVHGIAVGWGFNSPALLERHEPFALLQTPKELAELFTKLINKAETK